MYIYITKRRVETDKLVNNDAAIIADIPDNTTKGNFTFESIKKFWLVEKDLNGKIKEYSSYNKRWICGYLFHSDSQNIFLKCPQEVENILRSTDNGYEKEAHPILDGMMDFMAQGFVSGEPQYVVTKKGERYYVFKDNIEGKSWVVVRGKNIRIVKKNDYKNLPSEVIEALNASEKEE